MADITELNIILKQYEHADNKAEEECDAISKQMVFIKNKTILVEIENAEVTHRIQEVDSEIGQSGEKKKQAKKDDGIYEIVKRQNEELKAKLMILNSLDDELEAFLSAMKANMQEEELLSMRDELEVCDNSERMDEENSIETAKSIEEISKNYNERFMESFEEIKQKYKIFEEMRKDGWLESNDLDCVEIMNKHLENMMEEIRLMQQEKSSFYREIKNSVHQIIDTEIMDEIIQNNIEINIEIQEFIKDIRENYYQKKIDEELESLDIENPKILKDVERVKELIENERLKKESLMENAIKYFNLTGKFPHEERVEKFPELQEECDKCKNVTGIKL